MLYLLLAIGCGAAYSIIFKLFACRDIDSLQAIAFNYLTAFLLGVALSGGGGLATVGDVMGAKEWTLAVVMGVMFMTAFVLMARSTARVGVAISTAAARVSLVLPVLLSYLLLDGQEPRWVAMSVIVAALAMMFWPERKGTVTESVSSERRGGNLWSILCPVGVFLLFGANNFCLKWAQSGMAGERAAAMFSAAVFFSAFVVSAVYYFAVSKGCRFSWRSLVGGIALGASNFFVTYCMMLALAEVAAELFFPIYNVGIVAIVTLAGVVAFGERLSRRQVAGLVVAAVGIVMFFV